MTKINKIRRKDRAVNDEKWIKKFLIQTDFGVLATSHENQPYAKPNLFVFDQKTKSIYLHTADKGHTIDNVKNNENVCFTVSKMGRLLPADTAPEFSLEYSSVVVFGRARILSDIKERIYGLQLLLDKYFPHFKPGVDYPQLDANAMSGVAVYKIEISSWSGKQKKVPPDFPGAFYFDTKPM